ncbi:MAG: Wadjet anti-phage system protein JetD domain-containing protein [Alkaliphilus sp.]
MKDLIIDREKIMTILKNHQKKKIELFEIEKKLPAGSEYLEYAETIESLLIEGYLKVVKASGYNGRYKSIPNAYYIEKRKLREDVDNDIQAVRLNICNSIKLDFYLTSDTKNWVKDRKYIMMIDEYIKSNGLPDNNSTVEERSYHISSDEKWLSQKNGLKVLKRVNLKGEMKITSNFEPAMFAVNEKYNQHDEYKHLIVENKSIYYLLLEILKETDFATLIYGAGWRIISCINDFKKQFPFKDKIHKFYYFGDLDFEGIKIWDMLSKNNGVSLASEFYVELLKSQRSKGKEKQLAGKEARDNFLLNLRAENIMKEDIIKVLDNGMYIPQEALKIEALKRVWRSMDGS